VVVAVQTVLVRPVGGVHAFRFEGEADAGELDTVDGAAVGGQGDRRVAPHEDVAQVVQPGEEHAEVFELRGVRRVEDVEERDRLSVGVQFFGFGVGVEDGDALDGTVGLGVAAEPGLVGAVAVEELNF